MQQEYQQHNTTEKETPMSEMNQHLSDQLDAVIRRAEEVTDHLDNFDEHKEELESGEREADDWLTEDTTEEYEISDRWDEGILSIERKVIFEFWFTLGGPNVLAEVKATPYKHQHWTEYEINSITLEGYWGGSQDIRNVTRGTALWNLIARTVESMGESEG